MWPFWEWSQQNHWDVSNKFDPPLNAPEAKLFRAFWNNIIRQICERKLLSFFWSFLQHLGCWDVKNSIFSHFWEVSQNIDSRSKKMKILTFEPFSKNTKKNAKISSGSKKNEKNRFFSHFRRLAKKTRNLAPGSKKEQKIDFWLISAN